MDFYGFIDAIEFIASKLHPMEFSINKVACINELIE